MSNCPKCGGKIKATYLKQNCPHCNANMFYYKFDDKLEQDRLQAQREVDAVNRFVDMLKASTIKTPWHIIRLILFFAPLASMCLPMFWAGHKNVSLITFIMSIINHGLDFGALVADKSYFFAVLSMVLIIALSIVEIICSLFSATKNGFARNMAVFSVNFLVLIIMALLVVKIGDGFVEIGFAVTMLIYIAKLILHIATGYKGTDRKRVVSCVLIFALLPCIFFGYAHRDIKSTICPAIEDSDISVISFNVASAFGTSFEDTDSMDRCGRFADYVKAYNPDFIGTQEINSYWLDSLDKSLEGYNSYGVKRGGDSEEKNSEMNAVFFKDSYMVVEENTIWLSETPDIESKYVYTDKDGNSVEAGCNRICTYAVLADVENIYLFLNTHLDNASEEARVFGASVILDKIDELKNTYPNARVVLTGDFNETSDEDAYRLLVSKLNDTTDDSRTQATYQEWGYCQTGDKPIDFIFTIGNAQSYWVLDRLDDGYVSDHYGIYAEINF